MNYHKYSQITPPVKIDDLCHCITVKNNKCKNKAKENNKCTYHNNRLNHILNSGICKKLVFEDCQGYNYEGIENPLVHEQQSLEEDKCNYIIKKCNDIGVTDINNKYYCDKHINIYKYEKPDECVICSETILYNQEVPLSCGHWFHFKCLKKCNKMECPMCRKYYNNEEIEMIYELIFLPFRERVQEGQYTNENNIYNFQLKIPRKIVISDIYGLAYVEIMYLEVTTLYKMLHLQYTSEFLNKVLLNLFKNSEYLEISLKVYKMFNKIIENNIVVSYLVKDEINFEEDNEYTLNYDKFQDYIENMYYSI
jgi:hypothetical protein